MKIEKMNFPTVASVNKLDKKIKRFLSKENITKINVLKDTFSKTMEILHLYCGLDTVEATHIEGIIYEYLPIEDSKNSIFIDCKKRLELINENLTLVFSPEYGRGAEVLSFSNKLRIIVKLFSCSEEKLREKRARLILAISRRKETTTGKIKYVC